MEAPMETTVRYIDNVAFEATIRGHRIVTDLPPADGVHDTAEKQLQPRPARMSQFRIEVTVPSASEQDQAGLVRAVKGCLIHNTLTNPSEIETVVYTGQ